MKIFYSILLVGYFFLTPMPVQAQEGAVMPVPQDYSREGLYKTCIEGIKGHPMENLDESAYCGCVSDKLAPHADTLKEDDTEKNRRKAMKDTIPCMDDHLKATILAMCEEINYTMAEEGQPMDINCACFYKKTVDNFVETFAENEKFDEANAVKQTERAQKAMTSCAFK